MESDVNKKNIGVEGNLDRQILHESFLLSQEWIVTFTTGVRPVQMVAQPSSLGDRR